jgi:hypothetical protein
MGDTHGPGIRFDRWEGKEKEGKKGQENFKGRETSKLQGETNKRGTVH